MKMHDKFLENELHPLILAETIDEVHILGDIFCREISKRRDIYLCWIHGGGIWIGTLGQGQNVGELTVVIYFLPFI